MSFNASFFQDDEQFFQEELLAEDTAFQSELFQPVSPQLVQVEQKLAQEAQESLTQFFEKYEIPLLPPLSPSQQEEPAFELEENEQDNQENQDNNSGYSQGTTGDKEAKESQDVQERKASKEVGETKTQEEQYYLPFETMDDYTQYFRSLGTEGIAVLREKASVAALIKPETINVEQGEFFYKAGLATFYNDINGLTNHRNEDFWEGNHYFTLARKHQHSKAAKDKALLIYHNIKKVPKKIQADFEERMMGLFDEQARQQNCAISYKYMGFCAFRDRGLRKDMPYTEKLNLAHQHLSRSKQLYRNGFDNDPDTTKHEIEVIDSFLALVTTEQLRVQQRFTTPVSSQQAAFAESLDIRFSTLQQQGEQPQTASNALQAVPRLASSPEYGASGTYTYAQSTESSFIPSYQALRSSPLTSIGAGTTIPTSSAQQPLPGSNAGSAATEPLQQAQRNVPPPIQIPLPVQQRGTKRKRELSMKAAAAAAALKTLNKTKRPKKKRKMS